MQFGLYVPQPNVTAGSPEIAHARDHAIEPLGAGEVDLQSVLAHDVLLEADRLGFDIILFAERHLGPDLAAWIIASAIGAQAKRLRSMIAIHPGLWHPVMAAKLAASLDRISPGRMAINIVTGWNEKEFRMFGGEVMLEDDSKRYARAKEFVDILRGVWTQSPFSFNGDYYKIKDADLQLRPATATTPEIFMAARTSPGLDMVASTSDWWFVDFPKTVANVEEVEGALRQKMADVSARAERQGRRVKFAFNPFIALGENQEAATADTEKRLLAFEPGADTRLIKSRLGPPTKAGGLGAPRQVRDQMRRYRDMGIELLLLKFFPTVENTRRIAEEIIEPMRSS